MTGKIYQRVARTCLMETDWFTVIPERERLEILADDDFAEIEELISATESITTAITTLFDLLAISELAEDYIAYAIHGGPRPDLSGPADDSYLSLSPLAGGHRFDSLLASRSGAYYSSGPDITSAHIDFTLKKLEIECATSPCPTARVVLRVLSGIHDQWIRSNLPKFSDPARAGKQFMFLPLPLIGWPVVRLDLIYLKPVLQDLGILTTDEKLLEQEYRHYSQDFCRGFTRRPSYSHAIYRNRNNRQAQVIVLLSHIARTREFSELAPSVAATLLDGYQAEAISRISQQVSDRLPFSLADYNNTVLRPAARAALLAQPAEAAALSARG